MDSDTQQKPPINKKIAVAGGASAAVIALALAVAGLKPDEGKRNYTYLDIANLPTDCYGHLDRTSKVGSYHSDAECEALLSKDAKAALQHVKACAPTLDNRPYQLAATTRLAFNIGWPKFCSSTIAKKFNAGNFKAACQGFPAWKFVNGKPVVAIENRRKREMAQCLTGL